MTKKSRIKVVLIILFLAGLSIALYLRCPKDTAGPKWGEGFLSNAECFYYNQNIISIIRTWRDLEKRNQDDSNKIFLVIDMDKKALWVEENGIIRSDRYIDLAPGVDWTLYYYSTKSKAIKNGKLILRNINDITILKNPEQFVLRGSGKKRNLECTLIDTVNKLRPKQVNFKPGNFIDSMNMDELGSPFIVTEDEYEEYNDFLDNSYASLTEKEKRIHHMINWKLSDADIKIWKRMEKTLYMEIEKRVHKTGYQCIEMNVNIIPLHGMGYDDFQVAQASVIARHSSLVRRLLNRSPNISASYVVISLGDHYGVWYVACDPDLQKTPLNQKLEFEFLIVSDENDITLKNRDFISEGREIINTLPDPNSPYIDW